MSINNLKICVLTILIILICSGLFASGSFVTSNNFNVTDITKQSESGINTVLEASRPEPFGINIEPLWGLPDHQNYDWNDVFDDIDYIRAGHPITLRITLRAQWITKCPQPPIICPSWNPYCHFHIGPGSLFDQCQQIVSRAQARGLPVLGILHGTPPWNDNNPATNCDNRPGNEPPKDIYWWTDFVSAMVELLPYIDEWEIWNEPDMHEGFTGSATVFAQKVYVPAYETIRQYSGKKIIGPGLAAFNGHGWDGGGDACDWISYSINNIQGNPNPPFYAYNYHHYERYEDSPPYYTCNMKYTLKEHREYVESCGVQAGFRLYLTEYGQPINNFPTCSSDADEREQCGDIEWFIWYQIMPNHTLNQCLWLGRPSCDKYFIYTLYDDDRGAKICRFGLFDSPHQKHCAAEMHRCKIHQYYIPGYPCPNLCAPPYCY